jgi:hypothetical protein
MLLALAAARGMKVASIDIESAVLECDMPPEVEVLMRLPQEVAAQMVAVEPEHHSKLNTNGCLVVQLDKALYGTVIASQLWYKKLSNALLSYGLTQSIIDRCVSDPDHLVHAGGRARHHVRGFGHRSWM